MRYTRKGVSAAVLAALLAVPDRVTAHENLEQSFAECTCVSSHRENRKALGRIIRTEGGVVATGANGYRNAVVGMSLADGTEITTDRTGSARAAIGNSCDIEIGPREQVLITRPAGPTHKICVKVSEFTTAPLPDHIRLGIAIHALIGFGITGAAITGGDKGASN